MEGRELTVRAEPADCAASNVNSRAETSISPAGIILGACIKPVSSMDDILEIDSMSALLGALSANALLLHELIIPHEPIGGSAE